MMNNMNQYGRKPGENINDPLIILPPPPRPPYPPYPGYYPRPYPRPYPPAVVIPIGRPCNGPGCRHDHDHHDRHDHHDYDHRRRGPWY